MAEPQDVATARTEGVRARDESRSPPAAPGRLPARGWRGLLGGFGVLAAGEVPARLLGLASLVAMTRTLGPVGFGVVAIGTTLVAWTALAMDAGTELLAVRDLGRAGERLREIAEPVLGLRLASGLALAGLMATAVALLSSGRTSQAFMLFGLVLPALALNPRFMAVAVQASGGVAVGNVLGQAILLGGLLLFVHGGDVRPVPILIAGSELAYALTVICVLGRRQGLLRPRINLAAWAATLRESRLLLAYQVTRAVMYSADLLLIGLILGSAAAGRYGSAYKPVLFLSGAMGLFFVSFLAAHGEETPGGGRILARRALRVVPGLMALAALVLSATAPWTVPIAFGPAFESAVLPLAILAWTLPVQALGGVFNALLMSGGHERTLLRNSAAGAGLNVAANLAVIPVLGIGGAAAVTLVTETGVQVANARAARRAGLT